MIKHQYIVREVRCPNGGEDSPVPDVEKFINEHAATHEPHLLYQTPCHSFVVVLKPLNEFSPADHSASRRR